MEGKEGPILSRFSQDERYTATCSLASGMIQCTIQKIPLFQVVISITYTCFKPEEVKQKSDVLEMLVVEGQKDCESACKKDTKVRH